MTKTERARILRKAPAKLKKFWWAMSRATTEAKKGTCFYSIVELADLADCGTDRVIRAAFECRIQLREAKGLAITHAPLTTKCSLMKQDVFVGTYSRDDARMLVFMARLGFEKYVRKKGGVRKKLEARGPRKDRVGL